MKEITENTIGAFLAMLVEEHMESMESGNVGPQPHIVFNDETETANIEQINCNGRTLKLAIKTSEGETVTFRIEVNQA